MTPTQTPASGVAMDSTASWLRLVVAVTLSTIGGVGMWSVVVALPAMQAEFGVDRAAASMPYTLAMLGFAAGGVVMGRLADRFGITVPLIVGTLALGVGYVAAGNVGSLWQVGARAWLLIGARHARPFGAADGRHLALVHAPPRHRGRHRGRRQLPRRHDLAAGGAAFHRRRRLARNPYRHRHLLRRHHAAAVLAAAAANRRTCTRAPPAPPPRSVRPTLPISPSTLQVLLCIAGVACCVAMSMPQVHIVAYCGDLGYGVARGAEMLSLMLGFGIISRIGSGFIADRIGGVRRC